IVLLEYEKLLLDKLFYKRSQVKISSLKTTFYEDLAQVKQALYDDVVTKSLFPFDPEKTRKHYRLVAIICIVCGIGGVVLGTNIVILGAFGVGLSLVGVILFLMVRYMPRKTAYGRDLYRRSKGYYLFIDKAEKYRQRYFEKENMFNEVLPYAIVFGQTKKFAKKMDKMGLESNQAAWYVSSQPFTAGVFIGSINNFSTSLSSA